MRVDRRSTHRPRTLSCVRTLGAWTSIVRSVATGAKVLGLSLLACGPAVTLTGDDDPGVGGETGGSGGPTAGDRGGTGGDPGGPATTAAPPAECTVHADCPEGTHCLGGQCQGENCEHGGCADEGSDGGGGEPCDELFECAGQAVCNAEEECVPAHALPGCDTDRLPPILAGPSPFFGAGAVVGLSFVAVDGEDAPDALVVARTSGAMLYRSGASPVALQPPAETTITVAAGGLLDDDLIPDIAANVSGFGLGIFVGDASGGFSFDNDLSAPHRQDSLAVVTGDFVDVGVTDVLAADSSEALRFSRMPNGGFAPGSDLSNAYDPITGIAAVPSPDDDRDLAFIREERDTFVIWMDPRTGVYAYVFGLMDDSEATTGFVLRTGVSHYVVVATPAADWTHVLVERVMHWPAYDTQRSWALPYTAAWQGIAADLDGDRRDEAILYDDGGFALVLHGHTTTVTDCYSAVDLPGPIDHIAAGDYDGDGRDELVLASGAEVHLLEAR